MRIGLIGLGRMGMNMARRLLGGGHEVLVYNRTPKKTEEMARQGAIPVFELAHFKEKLLPPRVLWLMLPAGSATDEHIQRLSALLEEGDLLIDGGNSYYKDSVRRFQALGSLGIRFLDVGVSGGIWGLERGYCLMAGGTYEDFKAVEPLFKTLAAEGGYLYCGRAGAGHFVKMIHNGIEYAMMQAYGEGFHLLENSPYGEGLDYADLARLWNRGSVIRSWLLELAETVFSEDARLKGILGYVEDSGEGRWTVQEAVESAVPAPVITLSLMNRFRSRDADSFSDKLVAALRKAFGGHRVSASQKG